MGLQNPLSATITTTGATDSIEWPGGWGFVVLTGDAAMVKLEYSRDGSNWATKTTASVPSVTDFRSPAGKLRLNATTASGTTAAFIGGY